MRPFSGIDTESPLRAAERYVANGFRPVPIPHRQKRPLLKGWPGLVLATSALPEHFNSAPQNIGLILGGEPGLADIDCDTVEAAVAAAVILPKTGMIFGRASKRASHYFYYCVPPTLLSQFKDPTDQKMLVELRCGKKDGGTGLQTVVPPSVHPSGEKIEFEPGGDGYPTNVDVGALHCKVAQVAAAALLARHWPEKGERHNAMLALAGGLWRAEWPQKAAIVFCRAVYRAVPTHDPQAVTRSDSEVQDTYRRGADALERGEEAKVTGWPTLAAIVGDKNVATAIAWLGSPATVCGRADATGGPAATAAIEPTFPAAVTESSPSSTADAASTYPYEMKDEGIVRVKETKAGSEKIRLTNFAARITDEVIEDDGVETKRHVQIQATVNGRTSSFSLPAAKFQQMDWPMESMGPEAYVLPNQREWARTAIQVVSRNIQTTRVYTHTGWRKVGDGWVYLHGAGAIGPNGVMDGVNVHLSGALSNFGLVLPADESELKAAVNASLDVIGVAPDHIVFPLIAAVYRGCIRPCDFGLWLGGPTGVFKSELAALAQQHYGAAMDARHLPASFASTGNALETVAFYAKDALLVIDDFAPHGSMQDVARYHGAAERILRAAGNSQGRGRLTSDAKLRDTKAPRGLVLVTGEDVPRGQSIRGRILIVEVGPGDVNTAVLTDNQQAAAQGSYAKALAAFIRHLGADYARQEAAFRAAVLDARARATKAHSRTPGMVADLQVGFESFLNFAARVDAITEARRAELADRCWTALNLIARAQRAPQDASEPARRFLGLLTAALASGGAHVASVNGGPPSGEETAWGWRLEETAREPRRVAKGACIGWLHDAALYLEPTAAYAAAQDVARSTGEPLAVSEFALNKRLKEKGLLASVDTRRETLTVRRTILGVNRKVLHLRATALSGDVGFRSEDVGRMSGSEDEPDNDLPNSINSLRSNVGFVGRNTVGESLEKSSGADTAAAREMEAVEL